MLLLGNLGQRHHAVRQLASFLGALLVASLVVLPLLLSSHFGNLESEGGIHVLSLREFSTLPVSIWEANALRIVGWLLNYLTIPLFVLCAIGLLLPAVTGKREDVFVSFFAIAGIGVVTLFAQTLYSRYLLPEIPAIIIMGARSLSLIANGAVNRLSVVRLTFPTRDGTLIATMAIALVVLAPSMKYGASLIMDPTMAPLPIEDRAQYIEAWPAGYGLREAVSYLDAISENGGTITVFVPDYSGPSNILEVLLASDKRINLKLIDWWNKEPVSHHFADDGPVYIVFNYPQSGGEQFTHLNPSAKAIWSYTKPGGFGRVEIYQIDLHHSGP